MAVGRGRMAREMRFSLRGGEGVDDDGSIFRSDGYDVTDRTREPGESSFSECTAQRCYSNNKYS